MASELVLGCPVLMDMVPLALGLFTSPSQFSETWEENMELTQLGPLISCGHGPGPEPGLACGVPAGFTVGKWVFWPGQMKICNTNYSYPQALLAYQ